MKDISAAKVVATMYNDEGAFPGKHANSYRRIEPSGQVIPVPARFLGSAARIET